MKISIREDVSDENSPTYQTYIEQLPRIGEMVIVPIKGFEETEKLCINEKSVSGFVERVEHDYTRNEITVYLNKEK